MVDLGAKILQLRKERNITQKELGEAVGVSIQAVSKWERGGTPDVDMIPRIAHHLGVSISELFGEYDANAASLKDAVLEYVCVDDEKRRIEAAEEIIWTVFKAVSGYHSIKNQECPYSPSPAYGPNNNCTRCQMDYNGLLANASVCQDMRYYFFMPRPSHGFSTVLLSSDEYAAAFKTLGDKDLLDILLFASQKGNVPFSVKHIAANTHIAEKVVEAKLNTLVGLRQLTTMAVALDDGMASLYKFNQDNTLLVPMLLMMREFLYPVKDWYISVHARTKPMLED